MPGDQIQKKSTDSFEFQGLFNKLYNAYLLEGKGAAVVPWFTVN